MRRTALILSALIAGCQSEPEEAQPAATVEHHHIRCTDDRGLVVVDTTDVVKEPALSNAAWTWKGSNNNTTVVGVPPYACVYRSWKGESSPTPLVREALPAEVVERTLAKQPEG